MRRAIAITMRWLLGLIGLIVLLAWAVVPAVAQQCEWSPLGSGINGFVNALFDDGTGAALYAGGEFGTAGGVEANRIARWDGTEWSPLGSGMNGIVLALTGFDDGTGPALYAGGRFTMAGGVAANSIAKWDGFEWSLLGSGISDRYTPGVFALTVFDDLTVPALYGLYAGGSFTMAGGVEANFIARWDGTEWSPLGSGMSGPPLSPPPIVYTLTVFDDGTGPALYAGGRFTMAGGVAANSIAKWDGTEWSPLGSGINGIVFALTVFDDGTGPALYAGGGFTTAGGVAASRIAKWNGTEWSALGSGMGGSLSPNVLALTVFNDGTGPALYAGGFFTTAGGIPANRIAKWDGKRWSALGSGMSGGISPDVRALTVFNDLTVPALYAGGFFTTAGGIPSFNIAAWRCAVP